MRGADRPGSTCPLNLLPLFQDPSGCSRLTRASSPTGPGDFPRAEAFHAARSSFPSGTASEDIPLASQYAQGFRKVSAPTGIC